MSEKKTEMIQIGVVIPRELYDTAMRAKRDRRISMSEIVREGMRGQLERVNEREI